MLLVSDEWRWRVQGVTRGVRPAQPEEPTAPAAACPLGGLSYQLPGPSPYFPQGKGASLGAGWPSRSLELAPSLQGSQNAQLWGPPRLGAVPQVPL